MLLLKRILAILEIDIHVGSTLLMRIWSILAGAALILIMPYALSKSEQGYYFTFSSLLAAQVFFELGLNTVITQIAGHEMAHLALEKNGLTGPKFHVERLNYIFYLFRRIYKVLAILFFVLILIGGFVFFGSNSSSEINWRFTWVSLVFFTSVNLYLSPYFAAIEGLGHIAQVAQLKLKQSVIGYLFLWTLLFCGFGLKAIIALPAASALLSIFWLRKNYSWTHMKTPSELAERISWKKEIFPFQWKIAVSWLSGYFIFQLFNPFVFKRFGPEEAGKLGLALTVFTTIGAFSLSWVNAKVPIMTKLIALKKGTQLKQVFLRVFIRSTLLNFIGSSSFVSFIYLCRFKHIRIGTRVSDANVLWILVAITLANHIIFSAAIFMRAHKEEPMLLNSIVMAILSIIVIFFASQFSIAIMMLCYSAIIIFISLPWTLALFRAYYQNLTQA